MYRGISAGRALDDPGTPVPIYTLVTPEYFATMGIPIVRGRGFTSQEAREGSNFDGNPVIVSEATARRFWPGEDPLGKRFAFGPLRHHWRLSSGEDHPHSASSACTRGDLLRAGGEQEEISVPRTTSASQSGVPRTDVRDTLSECCVYTVSAEHTGFKKFQKGRQPPARTTRPCRQTQRLVYEPFRRAEAAAVYRPGADQRSGGGIPR